MIYTDNTTGWQIGDTKTFPIDIPKIPKQEEIQKAFSSFILSASGWRKILAQDGEEESTLRSISAADGILLLTAARVFGESLRYQMGREECTITVGLDTRPTGPVIGDLVIREFLGMGISVRYLFVAPAPEIMAYTKREESVDGFFYISASHNPVGHNGIKFGFSDGAVAGGDVSAQAIETFTAYASDRKILEEVLSTAEEADRTSLQDVYGSAAFWKRQALETYTAFTETVISGTAAAKEKKDFFINLQSSITRKPLGVIAELNGSSRTLSLDESFLLRNGIKVKLLNSVPGEITHPIVPEGDSLIPCMEALKTKWSDDPDYLFGYVPDNDGDRGNIVYMDTDSGEAKILEAQEVFALACLSELAFLEYLDGEASSRDFGNSKPSGGSPKTAVAVNGPTSLRIDEITQCFGAEVFRAEVGEANVVTLATRLRREGYRVRILGEGSNGGNITHPSTVRDPINTLFSLIKLLRLPPGNSGKTLFQLWMDKKREHQGKTEGNASFDSSSVPAFPALKEIIQSLPPYATTNAFEPEAKLGINTSDQALLKKRWEEIFLREWEEKKDHLKNHFGFDSWEEINYEGSQEKHGFGPEYRSGREKGGLKMLFKDEEELPRGFIWMRGSGTEPVFRILADYRGGDREKEGELLAWQREMVQKADSLG